MRNFNQSGGNRGGFKPDRRDSGRQNFGRRDRNDRDPVTMHKAICAGCNEACEVPFRPSGDKPVYCKSCFDNMRSSGGDRAPRKDFGRPSFTKGGFDRKPDRRSGNEDTERQFKTIMTKLDQLTVSINRLVGDIVENKTDSKVESKPIAVAKKVIVKKPVVTKKAIVKKAKKS